MGMLYTAILRGFSVQPKDVVKHLKANQPPEGSDLC